MIEYRTAGEEDWPILAEFYRVVYRENHPLGNRTYWRWRCGSPEHGRAFIALDHGRVVGHLAANFQDGYAWVINLMVLPDYRGRGLVRVLYAMARKWFPVATTNVNRPGLNMYRKMKWVRYYDLQRFTLLNPKVGSGQEICRSRNLSMELEKPTGDHYWSQPGLKGVLLPDGTTAVDQMEVGGLRLVHMDDPRSAAEMAWRAGAAWVDYITSWNDPLYSVLEDSGWLFGDADPVPWQLNPVVWGSKASVSLLSQEPLPPDLIVRRTHCDHGRVGSLPPEAK